MAMAYDETLSRATNNELKKHPVGPNFQRSVLKNAILNACIAVIEGQNAILPKTQQQRSPRKLENFQIAMIIQHVEPVICVCCDKDSHESDLDILAVYQTDGPRKGTYDTSQRALDQIIAEYNHAASTRDIKEVREILMRDLPRVHRCMDPDLIAVNNGIFNYKTKTLLPFSPEKIFLSKSGVDYNPYAQNVVIHNPDDNTDWDVESWIAELSNDPEIVNLLWEILGAIVRPFVRWNKAAWFFSTSGNSGKGTLCELMRNLCGREYYASIALADFAKEFQLELLIGANAIIVDENDVGFYLDKCANLKAVITNDALLINRKYKAPITYQFFGFMVQCLNEYPRLRDQTNSFYRRQLFIPFDKCFTGTERRYIKDDYLSRKEVLEYVLLRVLNMNYYELSEPAVCKELLDDLKISNDPVRQFCDELLPQFAWDLLPYTFLYDAFKAYSPEINPSSTPMGRNYFIRRLKEVMQNNPVWSVEKKQIATGRKMSKPEPLIRKYNLSNWMNPNYFGVDADKVCLPVLKPSYRGLLRKVP